MIHPDKKHKHHDELLLRYHATPSAWLSLLSCAKLCKLHALETHNALLLSCSPNYNNLMKLPLRLTLSNILTVLC